MLRCSRICFCTATARLLYVSMVTLSYNILVLRHLLLAKSLGKKKKKKNHFVGIRSGS